jgi:hypothetical protein
MIHPKIKTRLTYLQLQGSQRLSVGCLDRDWRVSKAPTILQSLISSLPPTSIPTVARLAIVIIMEASRIKCVFGGSFALWKSMR